MMKNSPFVKQIAAAQAAYNSCLLSNGGLLALDAIFTGQATIQTDNGNAPGPFAQNATINLHFGDWDHSAVGITGFPAISVTFMTLFGSNTTTITMTSGSGTYDRQKRILTMTLALHFHQSISLAGDSTLNIQLSNSIPMTSNGGIQVSGSAPFKGGFLDKNECVMTVDGMIAPVP
jgi:hypothetical protein